MSDAVFLQQQEGSSISGDWCCSADSGWARVKATWLGSCPLCWISSGMFTSFTLLMISMIFTCTAFCQHLQHASRGSGAWHTYLIHTIGEDWGSNCLDWSYSLNCEQHNYVSPLGAWNQQARGRPNNRSPLPSNFTILIAPWYSCHMILFPAMLIVWKVSDVAGMNPALPSSISPPTAVCCLFSASV